MARSSLFVVNGRLHHSTAGAGCQTRYGVGFLYRDFRPGFRQGQAKARELGLYMQNRAPSASAVRRMASWSW